MSDMPQLKQLAIHVGYGKTGTTSIQRALRMNAANLLHEGVFCCDLWLSKGVVGDAGFSSQAEFFHALKSPGSDRAGRLEAIFNPNNPAFGEATTIVWSNEALTHKAKTLTPFFEHAQKHFDINIVIYLRNQVDWLISAYCQWAIKDKTTPGRIRSWTQFVRDSKNSTDYIATIEAWRAAVGSERLFVRSYDKAENVVTDFFDTLAIKASLSDISGRVYETPNYTALALFKVLNDQFDTPNGPEPLLGLMKEAGLLDRDIHSVDPTPLDISLTSLQQLFQEFHPMNSRLHSEYDVTLGEFKKADLVGRRPHSSEQNTDLIASLLMLIINFDRKIKLLSDNVTSLQKKLQKFDR